MGRLKAAQRRIARALLFTAPVRGELAHVEANAAWLGGSRSVLELLQAMKTPAHPPNSSSRGGAGVRTLRASVPTVLGTWLLLLLGWCVRGNVLREVLMLVLRGLVELGAVFRLVLLSLFVFGAVVSAWCFCLMVLHCVTAGCSRPPNGCLGCA